jgi:hypothetical protein
MNVLDAFNARVKKVVHHKHYIRLFVFTSLMWVAVTAPVFWKPLPYVVDIVGVAEPPAISLSQLESSCASEAGGAAKASALDCKQQAFGRIESDRSWQLANWAFIVLFFPVGVPLVLLAAGLVFSCIEEGVRSPR